MPRKGQWPPPIYPRNAAPGQRTFCRIFRDGKPHDYPLGPAGSQEQKEAYARLQAELLAGEAQPSSTPAPVSVLSVVVALSRFADHAETRYASTAELHHFRAVLRVVRALYASLPLSDFGPKHLGAVRAALVNKGWCRRTINRALTRVKTCWRWLEAEGLTAPGTWHGLCAVGGVQYGHAPDKGDVLPVPEADLLATLPCLSPTVRAAALVQLHCGGRPSEVLGLRPCDIQRTGTVQLPGLTIPLGGIWAAVLARHKMSHRGRTRVLLFGPAAQEALTPLLDRPAEAFLFSPREAYLWYCQLHGKTPNLARRANTPGGKYRHESYCQAIQYGCKRAGVTVWTPYRLRKNAATRLATDFGPEVARIVLGHRTIDTTRIYLVDDLTKAAEAMRRVG